MTVTLNQMSHLSASVRLFSVIVLHLSASVRLFAVLHLYIHACEIVCILQSAHTHSTYYFHIAAGVNNMALCNITKF